MAGIFHFALRARPGGLFEMSCFRGRASFATVSECEVEKSNHNTVFILKPPDVIKSIDGKIVISTFFHCSDGILCFEAQVNNLAFCRVNLRASQQQLYNKTPGSTITYLKDYASYSFTVKQV
jgi:hypothetical protein